MKRGDDGRAAAEPMLTGAAGAPIVMATASAWRAWWPWAIVLLGLIGLFQETAWSMVLIWIRSETFTHAFLVPPIVLWLAWRKREQLALLTVGPVPWLLAPVALMALLWLLGDLAAVQSAQQFALVAMVVLSVPAVLGWPVARVLAFPLGFLFFAVPVGEFLVPWLMERTADVTVFALRASSVPVYREGQQFVIPSGHWSVVEACSGLRYMVASFMVGTLFAYLNFNSLHKRLAFVVVSLVVPLLANWLRAYLIVMIGHLSSNKLAAGADHLIYGWVFFGVVMALMFLVGARWADPEPAAPAARVAPVLPPAAAAAPGRWWQAVALLALCAAVLGYRGWLEAPAPHAPPALTWPPEVSGGWVAGEAPPDAWKPAYQRPPMERVARFTRGDRVVDLWLGYYHQRQADPKMVSSTNVLVEQGDRTWAITGQGQTRFEHDGKLQTWRTAELRDANPLASTPRNLVVWHVYWVGDRWIVGDARAKLVTAWERLLGRDGDGAVLMLSTSQAGGGQALQDLAGRLLPTLGARLAEAGGRR